MQIIFKTNLVKWNSNKDGQWYCHNDLVTIISRGIFKRAVFVYFKSVKYLFSSQNIMYDEII